MTSAEFGAAEVATRMGKRRRLQGDEGCGRVSARPPRTGALNAAREELIQLAGAVADFFGFYAHRPEHGTVQVRHGRVVVHAKMPPGRNRASALAGDEN